MVFEQIRIKKGEGTITGLLISLLIVMGLFFGCYLYVASNIETSGSVSLDSKYTAAYDNLSYEQDKIEDTVDDLEDDIADIKESQNVIQAAWNGLKGLGSIILSLKVFISFPRSIWSAIVPTMDIIPPWIFPIVFIGLLLYVVLLILKAVKGEPSL